MSSLQRVATDEMPIGMALGSPSQAPQYQSPRPHNLSHVQFAPPSSSSRPPLTSAEWTPSTEPNAPTPPPASRQKGKWKLFGGLFKKPPPQSQQPFYKLEPEAAQEADPEPDWLRFPEPPAATEKEKERGWGRTKSERRPQTAKPKLARSATAPVDGPAVGTTPRETRRLEKRDRAPPVDTPMETHVEDEWTAMTPKENSKTGKSLLAVEIPTTEMERYSVMFSSLLDKKRGSTGPSTSGLLARRQATLDRLKSVNETIAELERTEQRLDAHKPNRPRRATSPNPQYSPHHSPRLSQSPRHSPSFSLFPTGATLATQSSQPNLSPTLTRHPTMQPPSPTKTAHPHRLAPKPLTRSNTSPAALTPLQESFTPPLPHPSRRHATDSETHATTHVATPPSYAPPPPPQSALPTSPYPTHQTETPTTPWTDRTTVHSPLSTASLPATPAIHLNARPPPQTEPEWEMIPSRTTQPESRDRSHDRYPRRYASPGSSAGSGSSGRGSESAGTQGSVSSASSAEAESPFMGRTIAMAPAPRGVRRVPSKPIMPVSKSNVAPSPEYHAKTQAHPQQQQHQHTSRRPAPQPLATMSSGSGDVPRAEPVSQVKVKGSVAVARQMSIARQRERERAEAEEAARGGMGVGVARQMSVSRARVTTAGARRAPTREGEGDGGEREREREREREKGRERIVGDAGGEGERVVGGEKIVVRNRARTAQRVVGGEGGGRKSEYGVLVG